MPVTLILCDLDTLDPAALKAIILHQHPRARVRQERLSLRAGEIEQLMLPVPKLNQMLFGRKSEKVLRQIEQLEIQLEDLQTASAAEEVQITAPAERSATAKPRCRPCRSIFHSKFKTHMSAHDACSDCGNRIRDLCEELAEMLEYVLASFKVLRHVLPKLNCDVCDRIVQAPTPSRPIKRGLAGPGVPAHVLVSSMPTIGCSTGSRKSTLADAST